MNILILDDDDRRHKAFTFHLLVNHFLTHTHTYSEFVSALESSKFDIIFLDHDLNFEQYTSRDSKGRELTGYNASLYIVKELPVDKRPQAIIIHSYNEIGALQMAGVLKGGGYEPILWPFDSSKHPLEATGIQK